MSDSPYEEWIAKADEDYGAALDLHRLRNPKRASIVCFHCQQCAEKYLKGFLTRYEVHFRKAHDLRELRGLCVAIDPSFDLITEPLLVLNAYAVDVRYPGLSATKEEARDAIKQIKQVRRFIRARLGLGTKR